MRAAHAGPAPSRRNRWSCHRAGAVCALSLAVLLGSAGALGAQTPPPPAEPDPQEPTAPGSLLVRVFGSVQWHGTDQADRSNSFTLGQLDLFVTSSLSERVSVLAEVVFEASTNTQVITDLERLQLTYRFNDQLNVSAGRYHTGIGYYNTAFHHGSFFETTIGRPRVFAFEDEGGVLPVHDVGVTVRGHVPRTQSSLHYLAEIGNGRTWDTTSPGAGADGVGDRNDAKATNVALSFHPNRWRGLEVGTSFYRDSIPDGPRPAVVHRIAAAYVVYRTPAAEILAEWLALTHRRRGDASETNHGGYVQVSRAWGPWRPYYRYDRLSIAPGTPIIGGIESSTVHIAGLRIDPSEWVGLKAQYERTAAGVRGGADAVRAELVFVF